MPSMPRDRVWMNLAAAPGAGTVALGAALPGYRTAADAGVQDGEVNTWVFVDGSGWEISACAYAASGAALTRSLIASSSGSLLSLSASATAFIDTSSRDLLNTSALLFGDGSDGDVTISSAVTLTRDMAYNNLTLLSGAALKTNGFRISVAGVLDLRLAPVGAILNNGSNGGAATSTSSGGAAGTSASAGLAGITAAAGSGQSGSTTNGSNGAAGGVNSGTYNNGGGAGPSGSGGAGSGHSGGAAATTVISNGYLPAVLWPSPFVISYGVPLTQKAPNSGLTGASGGSGGGDGTNRGGASGGGGGNAGGLWVAARFIKRTGCPLGAIQAMGGSAGAGFAPTTGNCGGAGGSAGAAGGYVVFIVGALLDSPASNIINVTGGNGAAGTNGSGTGLGGSGGASGGGGTVTIVNLCAGTSVTTFGAAPVAGGAASGAIGGSAGLAVTSQVTL